MISYFPLALARLVGVCPAHGSRVSKRLAQQFWIEFGPNFFVVVFWPFSFLCVLPTVELLWSLWILSYHFSIQFLFPVKNGKLTPRLSLSVGRDSLPTSAYFWSLSRALLPSRIFCNDGNVPYLHCPIW